MTIFNLVISQSIEQSHIILFDKIMELNKGFKVGNRGHSSVKIIKKTLIKVHEQNFQIRAKKFIISYSIGKKQMDKLSNNKKYSTLALKNETKQLLKQQVEKERLLRMQTQNEEKLKRKSESELRKKQMTQIHQKRQKKINDEFEWRKNQLKRENGFKKNELQRKKSERSLIIEDRKDNYKMMKKVKLSQSKSQRSIANQSLRETIFNHKFQQQRKKLQKKCKQYELQYRKSFLKNIKKPRQICPNDQLSKMLQEKSKEIKADISRRKFIYSSQVKRPSTTQLKPKTIEMTPAQSRKSHRNRNVQQLIEQKIEANINMDVKHTKENIIAVQLNPQVKDENKHLIDQK